MKDSNDIDKGGGVRKYRYIPPSKKANLSQQWAKDDKSDTLSSNNKFASGINLDNVWSIKKNVSIDSKTKRSSDEKYSYGFTRSAHEHYSSTKPFFSRHKSSPGSITSLESPTRTVDSSPNRFQRPWHNAHIGSNTNDASNSLTKSIADEFDFELPSSNSTQWNENNTRYSPKNYRNSTDFNYSGEVDRGNSNANSVSGSQANKDSNFSSKYNYYFKF